MFKDHNPPVTSGGFSSDEVLSELTGTVVTSPTGVVIFGVIVEVVDKTGLSETSRKTNPAVSRFHGNHFLRLN